VGARFGPLAHPQTAQTSREIVWFLFALSSLSLPTRG
jgi:hypothetical protein